MTRGFLDTGRFAARLAVESDRDCCATYRKNFGNHVIQADMRSFVDDDLVSVLSERLSLDHQTVVIGGPPCQGFSALNRDGVGPERRRLWVHYLTVLESARPSAFVMENVPALLASQEYSDFKTEAEDLGFNVGEGVLDAADFGVPQRRQRAIVVGLRDRVFAWPKPTHADRRLANQLNLLPWRTFREAVHGLPVNPNGESWHKPRNPWPESIERYKAVPPNGGDRFQMQATLEAKGRGDLVPPCWRNKPTGTTDVFGRLWWDRPSVTIRTEFFKPEKGRYLHPEADRPITVREAALLMSFEPSFDFPESQSMTSVARQIGNAVPPRLAAAIASALAKSLDAAPAPAKGAG